jgi:serine/threonine protein kinase
MVMEYASGGDLLQWVKQKKRLDENEAKRIFRQVVHGLAHCHCRSVLHRDIKLDNVLMDTHGNIQICDFGVSRLINKDETIQEQCGTPAYLAPEIIADKGYRGFWVDIWSLGVLLYAILQGTVPFKGASLNDLHALILKGNFKYPVPISSDARDLIEKMLVVEPTNRIPIPCILRHSWLKGLDGLEEDSQSEDEDDHNF